MTWDRTALECREGSPSRRACFTLTDEIHAALDKLSAERGVPRSEVVRTLIRDAAG